MWPRLFVGEFLVFFYLFIHFFTKGNSSRSKQRGIKKGPLLLLTYTCNSCVHLKGRGGILTGISLLPFPALQTQQKFIRFKRIKCVSAYDWPEKPLRYFLFYFAILFLFTLLIFSHCLFYACKVRSLLMFL